MGRPLLLLEAAYSYRENGEDRLTELFATALDAHPGLCRGVYMGSSSCRAASGT
jgi:hypothetical protein